MNPNKNRVAPHLEFGTRDHVGVRHSGVTGAASEPLAVVLRTKGRFTVAMPQGDYPVLRQSEVGRTVAAIREDTVRR